MSKWETPIYMRNTQEDFSNPAGNVMKELKDAELERFNGAGGPNTYDKCYSQKKSCGNFCTFTTECPVLSFCC